MKILLVGCGQMGGAMLAGWLDGDAAADAPSGDRRAQVARVDIIDPHMAAHADARVHVHSAAQAVSGMTFDVAVLAVKPQVMAQACAALAPVLDDGVAVVSIAAGIPLARLASLVGERPLVRAMPNTPGAIGRGITGYVDNNKLSLKQRDTVDFLLSGLGSVVHVGDEIHMDAVTALSGSGPAYVFALTEAMEQAGVAMGLPATVAARLARHTVEGAGALMAAKPETGAAELRRAVTSPGGTTEAALGVLGQDKALDALIGNAVKAACKRSKDLAQSQ